MANMLIFSVDDSRYAIPFGAVESIVRMVRMKPDLAPRGAIMGTVDFHGSILPVYSVRRIFGHRDREAISSDVLIIVQIAGDPAALWADGTSGIYDMPVPAVPESNEKFSPGTFRATDGTIIIRDPEAILKGILASGSQSDKLNPVRNDIPNDRGILSDTGPEDNLNLSRNQATMSSRAAELARPQDAGPGRKFEEFLWFRLMYQEYAIGMHYVREVILTGEITPVPGTPDFIAGICAIRGEIISLVDLRGLFSLTERGLTDLNRVIVITDGVLTFGILADTITGVGTIDRDQLSLEPEDTLIDRRYLRGIIGKSTIVLDAPALLADPRMIIDEKEV